MTDTVWTSDGLADRTVADPDGLALVTAYGYDRVGNPTRVWSPNAIAQDSANPAGLPTVQRFSADRHLVETLEPVALTGGAEHVVRQTSFGLDPAGRKTAETVAEVTLDDMTAAAPVVVAGPTVGREVAWTHQAAGPVAVEFDPNTPADAVSFLHNLDGTLASAVDATGELPVEVAAAWEPDGNPVEVVTTVDGDPFSTVTGTWLPDGERAGQSATSGAATTSQSWGHNGAGMITSATVDFGDSTGESASYAWTSAATVDTATYGSVSESRSFLPDGTLTGVSAAGGSHSYTHDGTGRVVDHTVTGIGSGWGDEYGYDGPGRVTTDGTTGFGWDPNTNRTSYGTSDTTYRADNSIATDDSTVVDYDSAGRRVHPDPDDTDCLYAYDFLNRTTGTTGASCTDREVVLHDPLDRQIVTVEGDDVEPADLAGGLATGWVGLADVVETHHVHDLLADALAVTTSRDSTDTTPVLDRVGYAAGPGRAPWALRHGSTGTALGTQVLLGDGRSNITLVTDTTGTQECYRRYDPFGGTHTTSTCDESSTANGVWYRAGREGTDGTYQYGARHYDPKTATWTTPDTARPTGAISDLSIGVDPLTANRYTYVNGNPINLVDPTGHCAILAYSSDAGAADRCRQELAVRPAQREAAAEMAEFLDDHGALPEDWDDAEFWQQQGYYQWAVLANSDRYGSSMDDWFALSAEARARRWERQASDALQYLADRDCDGAIVPVICRNKQVLTTLVIVGAVGVVTGGVGAAVAGGAGLSALGTAVVAGAAGGAGASAAGQLATTGTIDPKTLIRDTLIGAATGAALQQIARATTAIRTTRAAPQAAAGVVDDGVNVIPSSGRTFVATPRGTVYDVPRGWAPRVADNGRGIVYQRPGAFRNADSIRIMQPTSKYPSGYARYYNSGNQPLDVLGSPGADPFTHIPQTYVGPWPGWPK